MRRILGISFLSLFKIPTDSLSKPNISACPSTFLCFLVDDSCTGDAGRFLVDIVGPSTLFVALSPIFPPAPVEINHQYFSVCHISWGRGIGHVGGDASVNLSSKFIISNQISIDTNIIGTFKCKVCCQGLDGWLIGNFIWGLLRLYIFVIPIKLAVTIMTDVYGLK